MNILPELIIVDSEGKEVPVLYSELIKISGHEALKFKAVKRYSKLPELIDRYFHLWG